MWTNKSASVSMCHRHCVCVCDRLCLNIQTKAISLQLISESSCQWPHQTLLLQQTFLHSLSAVTIYVCVCVCVCHSSPLTLWMTLAVRQKVTPYPCPDSHACHLDTLSLSFLFNGYHASLSPLSLPVFLLEFYTHHLLFHLYHAVFDLQRVSLSPPLSLYIYS